MLTLTMQRNDAPIWVGHDIRVFITDTRGRTIKLGIEAPPDVRILRDALYRVTPDRRFEWRRAPGRKDYHRAVVVPVGATNVSPTDVAEQRRLRAMFKGMDQPQLDVVAV